MLGGSLVEPQTLYCHPRSTISALARSHYLLSQMTAGSTTKVCRVTLWFPVPGVFSGSVQLGWFKGDHRLCGIWFSTFLQLPAMLFSNPSSHQEDKKRCIFLMSHMVVALQWP